MFGYVFAPISVFFIYNQNEKLHHVVYQVNNTFKGRCFYLCATDPSDTKHRHTAKKELYVSPFYDVKGEYKFALSRREEQISLNIDYHEVPGAVALNAHLAGKRKKITNRACLKILASFPFMTLGLSLIHI